MVSYQCCMVSAQISGRRRMFRRPCGRKIVKNTPFGVLFGPCPAQLAAWGCPAGSLWTRNSAFFGHQGVVVPCGGAASGCWVPLWCHTSAARCLLKFQGTSACFSVRAAERLFKTHLFGYISSSARPISKRCLVVPSRALRTFNNRHRKAVASD